MVAEGKFREHLYYRLNLLEITMPPLRERGEDIPDLIRFFLARESARLGLPQALEIDPVAEELLLTHDWPGNLRELQNVIARALVLADGSVISVADLPRLGAEDQAGGAGNSGKQGSEMAGSLRDRVRYFESEQIRQTLREANGDRHAAAKELGIGLSTLYRKLEESDPPRNSGDE